MLNANKAASVTNFTVVILDIADVEAWDPGVGRKRGWGDYRVAVQVEGEKGWHVRPPH